MAYLSLETARLGLCLGTGEIEPWDGLGLGLRLGLELGKGLDLRLCST